MSVVRGSRAKLDLALQDQGLTLLLLSGSENGTCRAVHDEALSEERESASRRVFLVTDLSILTSAERTEWIDSPDRYVVLGGSDRRVVRRGPITDLLKAVGSPSIRKIISAFAAGDSA